MLAATEYLPTGASLAETVRLWGQRLRGTDLQVPFVDAARLRLFLAAVARHHGETSPGAVDVEAGLRAFRSVQVGDGLTLLRSSSSYRGHLLLNPPYGSVPSDAGCDWTSGIVSQAAVVVLAAAQSLATGQRLFAILPDVLRSGSRYEPWRSRIEALLNVERADLYGQFDAHTDIDVFLLRAVRQRKRTPRTPTGPWWPDPIASTFVEDAFEVRVGPVVDNRDPHEGPTVPYLIARDLPCGRINQSS